MASSSAWRTSSSPGRRRVCGPCGLRVALELLPVRFDPVDLRLFLAVDLPEDFGPWDAQPVRMHRPSLALLLDVAFVDPLPPPELLHRDADLRLPQAGDLLDLHGRGLVPLREEHEGLRDVLRYAGLDEQVHQGLVPTAEADFPAHLISSPIINWAIYNYCPSSVHSAYRGPLERPSATSARPEIGATRNPLIAVPLCLSPWSALHEDAPVNPRLLPLLPQARGAG